MSQTDASGGVTSYTYNLRGDLTLVIDPDFNHTSFSFDGNSRLVTQTRASLATNTAGVTSAVNSVTNFSYDLMGKLVRKETLSATGGGSHVETRSYDAFDRLQGSTAQSEISGTVVSLDDNSTFTYSPQMDAAVLTSANNQIESLSFVSEKAPPFLDTAFGVQAVDPINALGLIQDEFSITRGVTGGITLIKNSAGKTLYSESYDPAGRLIQMSSKDLFGATAPALRAALEYDGFGRKSALSFNTGMAEAIQYDLANRTTGITWKSGFAPLSQESLSYDLAGNIVKKVDENGFYDLGYDKLNQLTSSKSDGLGDFLRYDRNFEYDLAGNRVTDSNRGAETFIANGIVSDAKATYQSDADGFGNIAKIIDIKTGSTKQFGFRADGRMNSFNESKNGSVAQATHGFDALGRRVSKSVTGGSSAIKQSYLYLDQDDKILLAQNGIRNLTLYIDGQGIDEHLGQVDSTKAIGYTVDHLGSVLNTEAAGDSHSFGLWGESQGNGAAPSVMTPALTFGFAGMEYDQESELYKSHGARMYDPTIGRWLSQDTIGFAGGDSNLYRYVGNQPLVLRDPSGTGPAIALACAAIDLAVFAQDMKDVRALQAQVDQLNQQANNIQSFIDTIDAGSSSNARAFCEAGNAVVAQKQLKAIQLSIQTTRDKISAYGDFIKVGIACGFGALVGP